MKHAIYLMVGFVGLTASLACADDDLKHSEQRGSKPASESNSDTNSPSGRMTIRLELFVNDIQKSVDFYTSVLGFKALPGGPTYAPVRCGAVTIGLGRVASLPKNHHFHPEIKQTRRGLGTEIVLEVDDVQAFFKKVQASGYKRILSPLGKRTWGLTDFRIADPDGYYVRVTSR